MLLERAELEIREGLEDAFAAVMNERGKPLLAAVPGVRSVRMGRGVENPGRFMMLVEWASLEAHAAFSKADHYPAFLELFAPYSKGGKMEHFEMG